jgi:casein kinase II subunit beta
MKEKIFQKRRYGVCPRFYCRAIPLMPMGTSPVPNRHSAKLFCSRCVDLYRPPPEKRFDGAHFGPAFPSVFLVNFPDFDGRRRFHPVEHRIFGFKIYRDPIALGPHATNDHRNEDELLPRAPDAPGESDEE